MSLTAPWQKYHQPLNSELLLFNDLLLKLEPLVAERRTRIFLSPLLDWYGNLYPAPADEARGELDCSLTQISSAIELRIAPVQCLLHLLLEPLVAEGRS